MSFLKRIYAPMMGVAALAAASILGSTGASATICFAQDTTTCPVGVETKIFLNAFSDSAGTETGTGQYGGQTGIPQIGLATTTPVNLANGYANITPIGNGSSVFFSQLTLSVPTGYTFADVVFDAQLHKTGTGSSDVEDITAHAFDGSTDLGSITLSNLAPNADETYSLHQRYR
jgi:hypothetical protein